MDAKESVVRREIIGGEMNPPIISLLTIDNSSNGNFLLSTYFL